jgi:hypothetical protein
VGCGIDKVRVVAQVMCRFLRAGALEDTYLCTFMYRLIGIRLIFVCCFDTMGVANVRESENIL